MTVYKIECNEKEKSFRLVAEYSPGSRCETRCKSFAQAIEVLEDWYRGDNETGH